MNQRMIGFVTVILFLFGSDSVTFGQTVVEGFIGGSVILPCNLSHQSNFQWKNGASVILRKISVGVKTPSSPWMEYVRLVADSANIEIRSLRTDRDSLKHNNTFICEYTGGEKTQEMVYIDLLGVQIQEAFNRTLTLVEGKSETLTCSVSGDPTTSISYSWEVDGGRVSGQSSKTFNLTAIKTTKTVTCRASNGYSNGTETVELNVVSCITEVEIHESLNGEVYGAALRKKKLSDVPFTAPYFYGSVEVTLITGVHKNFTCSVNEHCTTPIYYTWRINGRPAVGQQNNTFKLAPAKTMETVTCIASYKFSNGTEFSSRNVPVRLNVLTIVTGVKISEADEGKITLVADKSKILTCSVSGNPTTPIFYTWDIDGMIISGENSPTFNLTAKKFMKNVGCTAYNKYSNGTELSKQKVTLVLNVLDPVSSDTGPQDEAHSEAIIAGGASGFVFLLIVIVVIVVLVRRTSTRDQKADTIKKEDGQTDLAFEGEQWKNNDAEITINELYTSSSLGQLTAKPYQEQSKSSPTKPENVVENQSSKPRHNELNICETNSPSDNGQSSGAFSGAIWQEPEAEISDNLLYGTYRVPLK